MSVHRSFTNLSCLCFVLRECCPPYHEARGVELFTDDEALQCGSRNVRGWEHMPLPNCEPPSTTPKVGVGLAEDTASPPSLTPHVYTALLRSILLPWGTRPPGETNTLRMSAASDLRDALCVSAEQHAASLIAARRANKGVVSELNERLKNVNLVAAELDTAARLKEVAAGTTSDIRRHTSGGGAADDSDDDDLTAAFRLEAEKRALEPIVSDLFLLPRFDATIDISVLKVEGKAPLKPKLAPKFDKKQSVPEQRERASAVSRVGEAHSATKVDGVKVEDVTVSALSEDNKPEVKGAGGLFSCCFGGGIEKGRGDRHASKPRKTGDDAERTTVDAAIISPSTLALEEEAVEDGRSEMEPRTETGSEGCAGQLRCTVTMISGAEARNGTQITTGPSYHSTPVRRTVRDHTTPLHVCAPQMRVSRNDAATALVEIRLYWTEDEAETKVEEGAGRSDLVSERMAIVAAGDGCTARAMRVGDVGEQCEGVLVGVALLRVADLEDTSESAVPRSLQLAIQPPPSGSSSPEGSCAKSFLPELTTVHVAADCFVESFVDADDMNSGSSEDRGGLGHLVGESLTDACVKVASSLWAGWERGEYSASGGPLDASLRAGLHVPNWTDGDICTTRDITSETVVTSGRGVIPPQGWRGVLHAFAILHRVSRATIALAEAEAIARRWRAGPDLILISELHARLATAVSAIASGRATSADESLHMKVAAVILPRAEMLLSTLLAPPSGSNAEEMAMTLRALTPVLALCLPLDTPAPKFANYLLRAARQAVIERIARDLTTPLAQEAKATAEVAEAVVSRSGVVGKDDDSEYDVGSHRDGPGDMSKVAFSQIATEAGQVASLKADGFVLMSTVSIEAAKGSDFLTLSRVTAAAGTAAACFPVDLYVYRALPPGVFAAPVALYSTMTTLMQAASEAMMAAGGLW